MRKGDWIETYTGKKFWPLDPRREDICIEDIAHGLSNICRYNGQCKFFFSVAQHSLNCVEYIARRNMFQYPGRKRLQLLCLLHDAAEAYISDVSKPVKPFLPGFREIENKIMAAIYEALNVRPPNAFEKKMVKYVDKVMLATEARVLMTCDGWGDWIKDIEPDEEMVIRGEYPIAVKERYLTELGKLLDGEDTG